MNPFLLQLIWAVVMSVVTRELFAPDDPADAEAASIGDLDAPTIDEGTGIPVVFGSVLTGRQNVSWYGGLGTERILQGGVVTGYKYRLTAQCSICMGPVDDIREVRFEDSPTEATWTETADYWDLDINQPEMFGGMEKEGGVVGGVRIYRGTTTQEPDVELATLANAYLPAYRRVCYAVLRDLYIGTSPRLKSPSFLVERCPNSLGTSGGVHVVGPNRDANPVCCIFDVLTDVIWGAATPADQFDLAQWRAAAAVVHAEGFGISMSLTSGSDVDSIVQGMCKYIDAVVYDDPASGLIGIQLVRESDLLAAPTLTADEVESVGATRISWTDLKSTVKVTYTDPGRNYETGGVMAQNSAVVRALGGAVDLESRDAPAFTSASVATASATRLLRAMSYPLSKVEVKGNRALASLRAGQAFRLQWARPSIDAYYRVTRVDLGSSNDPWPTVSGVEDVFAAASNTFTPPVTGGGGAVGAAALPVTRALLMEMPYYLRRNDSRSVLYGAARPNSSHTGYKVTGNETLYDWLSSAPLTSSIAQWSGPTLSSITLAMTLPDDVDTPSPTEVDAGGALLLVGAELMSYSTVTRNGDSTVTFGTLTRGVLDTVPAAHEAGELAMVVLTARVRRNLDLTSDGTVSVAARTFTAADSQTVDEATVRSITTTSRAARPLAPGALKVNGVLWGAGPHAAGATVSWEPRTRQATTVLSQVVTGQAAEGGTDYVLRVYSGGTLLATYTPAGTSQVLAESGSLVLTLHARRGGLESWQGHRLVCSITASVSHLLLEDSGHLLLESGDALLLEA